MLPTIPNKVLNRNIVPALWDGNIITPYQYDASSGRYSSIPVSTYYYELPKILTIRGRCLVLIDTDQSTDNAVSICDDLYPYVDKSPEHEGILRVVKNTFKLFNATKHTAPAGMFFRGWSNTVSAEEVLPLLTLLPRTLNLELIDEEPDHQAEIIDNLLVPEMQDEIDRETIAFIMSNLKSGEENGTRPFENVVNTISDAAKSTNQQSTDAAVHSANSGE